MQNTYTYPRINNEEDLSGVSMINKTADSITALLGHRKEKPFNKAKECHYKGKILHLGTLKKVIARTPILSCTILPLYRARTAVRYFHGPILNLVKWLFKSKETANFTYDLEENNKYYLASLIANVLGIEFNIVIEYIREIEEDERLKQHISNITSNSNESFIADKEVRFGRRIGWYAIAIALKPKVIIETGVDKGLDSCVLTAALKMNREEGYEGKYMVQTLTRKPGTCSPVTMLSLEMSCTEIQLNH